MFALGAAIDMMAGDGALEFAKEHGVERPQKPAGIFTGYDFSGVTANGFYRQICRSPVFSSGTCSFRALIFGVGRNMLPTRNTYDS